MTAFEAAPAAREPVDACRATPCSLDELRQVYVDHCADLTRFAARLTGDLAEAEDLVQTAFERLIARRLLVTRPLPFLYRTVVNLANDRWRRRSRDARLADALRAPDEQPPVDVGVADAVRRLPDDQRTAIALYYFADLDIAEVAAVMKRPPGTVGRLLWEARRALSAHLGGPDA